MSARRGIFFNSKSRTNDKINELPTEILPKETTTVKKKIILNHAKRTLTKTIYSGPRKIFSTNYKANRTQLNHKAFFGGNTDEFDSDNRQITTNDHFSTRTIIQHDKTKIEKTQTATSNIRQVTTCSDLDETQSYIDDMDYLLVGFQSGKSLDDRCLSAIKFAELCTRSSFRNHLRTDKSFERIFIVLRETPNIPSLNLCASFILYIFSLDILSFEMNTNLIRLILDLNRKSSTINLDDFQYNKMKERLLTINKTFLSNEIFYEENFNTRNIILEMFYNISRNNFKESLKDELRLLGGFDLIIDSIHFLVDELSNNDIKCYSNRDLTIRYEKVSRFINVLEEFSTDNCEQSSISKSNIDVNRMYIAQFNQYSLFHSLSKLLDLSLGLLQQQSTNTNDIYRDVCKSIMSIFVILTNDCEINCDRLTSDNRFFSNLFRLLATIEKSSFKNEDKFDTLALTLNLLINLVQNIKHIYKYLMEENMPDGSKLKIYEYLAKLFCEHELSAARAESQEENDWMMEDVDNDFDEQSDKQSMNENGSNFNRALQKAAGHMENTFVAAFSAVILAVILLRDRSKYVAQIQDLMPQKKFDTMAFILKKFFVFMHMSHAFTPSGVKILEEIISMVLSLCG